jgi:chromate transport protein ChrA
MDDALTKYCVIMYVVSIIIVIGMTTVTMSCFQRVTHPPKWFRPVMISLLVLFFLFAPINPIFFIIWIILIVMFWRRK